MKPTLALAILLAGLTLLRAAERPVIDGEWWSVTGNPDLGGLTGEKQQPVDFGIWQAADGTWQLWSCIRHTKAPGKTRLFHRWEGKNLTDTDWEPKGIAMEADPSLGEEPGGLQAPYVFKHGGKFMMVYGDWGRICLAESADGKTFTRVLNDKGQPDLFSGPYDNTRDAMVLRFNGLHLCYYMGHRESAEVQSMIFCRTSADLEKWSEPMAVSGGGAAVKKAGWYGGDAECPFVVRRGDMFYLFRNQEYGEKQFNTQYASADPFSFGVNDDSHTVGTLEVAAPEVFEHEGQWYIAALKPGLDGIRIARLKWVDAAE